MPLIHKPLVTHTFTAEAAITKFAAVIHGTDDGEAKLPGAANDESLGIALHAAAADEAVEVCMFGPCTAVAAAAIARGDIVAISGTAGKVTPITPGVTTADQRVVGRALGVASADGDYVSIFVGMNDYCAV